MGDTWLEADGRRLPMRRVGEFSVQIAISSDVYDAGVFLVGDQTPTHEWIVEAVIKTDDELCLV